MIPAKIKNLLKKKIVFFATASKKSKPNLVAVESIGLFDNKILIADCAFNKTLKNLQENKAIAICVFEKTDYFQIKGKATYVKAGKYFDIVKKHCEGTPYKPKGALLINIKEIYDLEKCKRIM